MEKLTDFKFLAKNPNKHTARGMGMLDKSISKYGYVTPMTATADGTIIDGNARLEQVGQTLPADPIVIHHDGTRPIIAVRDDIPNGETKAARAIAIAANRVGQIDLEWNPEEIASAQCDGVAIEDFFTQEEIDKITGGEVAAGLTDPDDCPEAPEEAKSKKGDLWILGEHRVLCGDSTSADAVSKLMNGEKADMVFTDPPYGVNYEGGHFHSGDVKIKRKREKLTSDDTTAIYAAFLPIAMMHVDGPCYMWFAASKARDIYNALFDNQCEIHALIIWHKTNATYAAMNAQYKQRHEPCIYFKPKGSNLRWCGATTEATVWNQDRDGINDFHPTQKPVALASKAIFNHTAVSVLDLFLGSGSTLIACEQLKRKCYGMELDTKYCDVIINRWQKFSGKEAVHENGTKWNDLK